MAAIIPSSSSDSVAKLSTEYIKPPDWSPVISFSSCIPAAFVFPIAIANNKLKQWDAD